MKNNVEKSTDWRDQLRSLVAQDSVVKQGDQKMKEASDSRVSEGLGGSNEVKIEERIEEKQQEVRKGIRHVMMSDVWKWSEDPFPSFRCNLVYGRNKRDREFLPVKDVQPDVSYSVSSDCGRNELYVGANGSKAKEVKQEFDAVKIEANSWGRAAIKESQPILPQGRFRVIKTRAKGTILVVPGVDKTDRCLLFVGCKGGFRGGVNLVEKATSANVLKKCQASNRCESSVEVIALMNKGEKVVFYSYGRRTNEVYVYEWDGMAVQKKHYSKAEWESRIAMEHDEGDVEVL